MKKMQEPIDGAVAVAAIFGGGRVKPVWFVWQGRKYAVREVTYAWEDREGAAVRKHFSVTDGTALFDALRRTHTEGEKSIAIRRVDG